jgi:NAD(P)H-quinone oxidoreductase subunit 5
MFRFDALAAVMLTLVAAIAVVILRFSARYLDGERGGRAYVGWFLATVAAAALLVVTNNLLVLALAWTGSSLALHQLLTFFRDRPQAVIAAHKKFLLSRIADLCILLAVVLIGRTFGTLQIDQLLAFAQALPAVPDSLALGGLLLATGVVLRSAQLPFHGWLIQVMEAPTPVSALLHAGIVNIGGFVMIRLGPMMVRLDAAQTLLVVVGTVTAVLAALVMTTRVSVKVSLAWSTAAQMGFMLLECGLGAYGLALLHLVAHSLYKAHAFLSSGRAVEQQLLRSMTPALSPASFPRWVGGAIAGLAVVGAAGAVFGLSPRAEPSLLALGVVFGLALAPLFVRASLAGRWRPAAGLVLALALTGLYAGWHLLFGALVPSLAAGGVGELFRIGLVALGFLALFAVQAVISAAPAGGLARRVYPACYAGFYLDEIFTRLTFKLWPPRPAPAPPALARQRATLSRESAA